MTKSSAKLMVGLSDIFVRRKQLTPEDLREIEDLLLRSDLGVNATELIISKIRNAQGIEDSRSLLVRVIAEMTSQCDGAMWDGSHKPHVIMFCGMNGSGKTTTIGKLARKLSSKKVGLVACDTFRAAAEEQLAAWSAGATLFSGAAGADPASIAYSGCASGKAQGLDYLLIDTAGRMHNHSNLMSELAKIERTIKKVIPEAPHKVVVVVDGNSGQNAMRQIEAYSSAVNVSGVIVTKLDGSSRGGIVVNIIDKYKLPVYYLGVGEAPDDLREFNSAEFADALLQ